MAEITYDVLGCVKCRELDAEILELRADKIHLRASLKLMEPFDPGFVLAALKEPDAALSGEDVK